MDKEIKNRVEIKDIIEKKPSFIVRWGISIFLLVIIIIFVIACLFDILSINFLLYKIIHFV